MRKDTKIIIIANQKGGVGKTTTALVLQSMYKIAGKKSLFIDFEIQGNGTKVHQALVSKKDANGDETIKTTFDVFVNDEKTNINDAIQHTEYGDIIAHDKKLALADSNLSIDPNGNFVVLEALSKLDDSYDVVIIDTQPALNKLLIASLVAGTHVIIPLTKEDFSLQGISQLNDTINMIKLRQNQDLIVEGLLITRKYGKETYFSQLINDDIVKASTIMNTKVFNSQIRETVALKESQGYNMSIFEYDKRCNTAIDYSSFFNELEGIDISSILKENMTKKEDAS